MPLTIFLFNNNNNNNNFFSRGRKLDTAAVIKVESWGPQEVVVGLQAYFMEFKLWERCMDLSKVQELRSLAANDTLPTG